MTGQNTLQDAVLRNDPVTVTALFDAGAIDACMRDGERWSWLAEALRLGHREVAQSFLDHPRGFLWESQCWSLHGLIQGLHDDAETPLAALEFVRRCDPNSGLGRAVTLWIPVIERMLAGKDVGLDEIRRLGDRSRVIRGSISDFGSYD